MKKRIIVQPSATAWRICPECKKRKPDAVGLTAGDGQRWYCCERCLDMGERKYNGNGRRA